MEEFTIKQIAERLRTSRLSITNVLVKLYPDKKIIKGQLTILTREEAENVARHFLKKAYPDIKYNCNPLDFFIENKLYKIPQIAEILGYPDSYLRQFISRRFNYKSKFKNFLFTQEELEIIKKELPPKKGQLKFTDEGIKINW